MKLMGAHFKSFIALLIVCVLINIGLSEGWKYRCAKARRELEQSKVSEREYREMFVSAIDSFNMYSNKTGVVWSAGTNSIWQRNHVLNQLEKANEELLDCQEMVRTAIASGEYWKSNCLVLIEAFNLCSNKTGIVLRITNR